MSGALNQSMTCDGNKHVTDYADIIRCTIIIIIMVLVIIGNVFCLIVFNSRTSKRIFTMHVRYMMNSMCLTDLGIGLLMCPSTIYPALKHCWPLGDVICKIEALLISALFHQSTLNMVLVAVDRYSIIHFPNYINFMTRRRLIYLILATWISVFTCYALVIFAGGQYFFDEIGINCEPYYENPDVTLSVISIFYFIPAIIIVFCYVSIYRTATRRKVFKLAPDDKIGQMVNANIRTSKYLAAITIGFFVAVSPWTLCTLAIAVANIKLPEELDYAVTWLCLSNSFWNCLIYGVMNRKFRNAAINLIVGQWMKSIKVVANFSKSQDNNSKEMIETSFTCNEISPKANIQTEKITTDDEATTFSIPTVSSPCETIVGDRQSTSACFIQARSV